MLKAIAPDTHQIIVNASGAIADCHGKDASWDGEGIQTAAVGSDFWSLEVFAPYAASTRNRPSWDYVWNCYSVAGASPAIRAQRSFSIPPGR